MKRVFYGAISLLIIISVLSSCSAAPELPVLALHFEGGASEVTGDVEIELYPDKAPNTVKNIIFLVRSGYFDGMKVNLSIPGGFVEIADGTGLRSLASTGAPPDYALAHEDNDLPIEKGSVAMSLYEASDMDSASDGFFIAMDDMPGLNGHFTVFGKVVKGMEVLEEINSLKTTGRALHYEPVQSVILSKASVFTKGVKYGEPEKLPRKYYVWNSYNQWWKAVS